MRWPKATDKKRSTSPSSTVVAVSTFGSYRDCLARPRLNEALNLGLVVLGSHAGADERAQTARGQIEFPRAKRGGHVDVHVHGGQPVARLARRFALLEERDDPALLQPEIVHDDTGLLCGPSPQHTRLHLRERDDDGLPGPTLPLLPLSGMCRFLLLTIFETSAQ